MSVMKELQKHAGTSGDEGASAPSFGKFGDQSSNVKMQQMMKAFKEGKITMDLLMLAIEPVIYTIISLATYAKIDPVLYPQDDMDDSKVPDEIAELRRKSKDLMVEDKDDSGGITVQEMEAPATAPKSLLARSKKAVEGLS